MTQRYIAVTRLLVCADTVFIVLPVQYEFGQGDGFCPRNMSHGVQLVEHHCLGHILGQGMLGPFVCITRDFVAVTCPCS